MFHLGEWAGTPAGGGGGGGGHGALHQGPPAPAAPTSISLAPQAARLQPHGHGRRAAGWDAQGRGVVSLPGQGGVSCTDRTQGSARMSCLWNRVFKGGRRAGEASFCSWASLRFVVCVLFFLFYLGCNVCQSFYFDILKETKLGPHCLSRRCCVPLRMPLVLTNNTATLRLYCADLCTHAVKYILTVFTESLWLCCLSSRQPLPQWL